MFGQYFGRAYFGDAYFGPGAEAQVVITADFDITEAPDTAEFRGRIIRTSQGAFVGGSFDQTLTARIDVTEAPDRAEFRGIVEQTLIAAALSVDESPDGALISAALASSALFAVDELADGFSAEGIAESWHPHDEAILFLP